MKSYSSLPNNTKYLQLCAKYIRILLNFTENLDLKEKFNVSFGYFHKDNYEIEFLTKIQETRLQVEYFFSFHPNSLILSLKVGNCWRQL